MRSIVYTEEARIWCLEQSNGMGTAAVASCVACSICGSCMRDLVHTCRSASSSEEQHRQRVELRGCILRIPDYWWGQPRRLVSFIHTLPFPAPPAVCRKRWPCHTVLAIEVKRQVVLERCFIPDETRGNHMRFSPFPRSFKYHLDA